jgi:hypothetical protein
MVALSAFCEAVIQDCYERTTSPRRRYDHAGACALKAYRELRVREERKLLRSARGRASALAATSS